MLVVTQSLVVSHLVKPLKILWQGMLQARTYWAQPAKNPDILDVMTKSNNGQKRSVNACWFAAIPGWPFVKPEILCCAIFVLKPIAGI